jgi:hypothetical protein
MADRVPGPYRGVGRRTLLRSGALAAGLVWMRPEVRTVSLISATGSEAPATTTPTTSVEPTMFVEAVSLCRGTASFAIEGRAHGFEPATVFAVLRRLATIDDPDNFGGGLTGSFTTDASGNALVELGLLFQDHPYNVAITIWADPDENQLQGPDEPTVFSGTFLNDRACKSGNFVPD